MKIFKNGSLLVGQIVISTDIIENQDMLEIVRRHGEEAILEKEGILPIKYSYGNLLGEEEKDKYFSPGRIPTQAMRIYFASYPNKKES